VKNFITTRKISKYRRKTARRQECAIEDIQSICNDWCDEIEQKIRVRPKPAYRVPVQRARARAYRSPMRSIHVGSIAACECGESPGGGDSEDDCDGDSGSGDSDKPAIRTTLCLKTYINIEESNQKIKEGNSMAVANAYLMTRGIMEVCS